MKIWHLCNHGKDHRRRESLVGTLSYKESTMIYRMRNIFACNWTNPNKEGRSEINDDRCDRQFK